MLTQDWMQVWVYGVEATRSWKKGEVRRSPLKTAHIQERLREKVGMAWGLYKVGKGLAL